MYIHVMELFVEQLFRGWLLARLQKRRHTSAWGRETKRNFTINSLGAGLGATKSESGSNLR